MSVELLEDGKKRVRAPLTDEDVRQLEAGDVVLISGTMYAARDAAPQLLGGALGGGGALAALQIRSQKVIAFPELGPEAIREMEVEDLPVWVVNDCEGRDLYGRGGAPWRKNDLLPEGSRLGAG